MSLTPTRVLLELIQKNVEVLEKACAASGTDIPDLHLPFHPSTEAFRTNPDAAEASNVIVAAAQQLAATLAPPQVALYDVVGGAFKSAAIRVCIESNVTEILREAGPQGLHVDDIAKINGQDSRKLGKLRTQLFRTSANPTTHSPIPAHSIATSHIPRNLFKLPCTRDSPEQKHDDTMGLAALASHHLDEAFKAAAYSWEACSDPATAHSGEPDASPFAKAFNKRQTLWNFYEQPEQKFRQNRFGIGMCGIQALQPPDAVMNGTWSLVLPCNSPADVKAIAFDWKAVPAGSLVVDVGGGIGSVTHTILKHCPDLKFVVQDLPGPVDDGKKWWATNMPQAIESGQVKLEVHDFLTPQPQKGPEIFMIKQIMHDWSDEYCVKILKHLRDAATPGTRLLVLESIIPYSCHDPSADDKNGIPGAAPKEAPAPLLANYGAVNEMGYLADIDMFLLFNSQERTVGHFDRLLQSTGWKLTVVNRQPGDSTYMQSMEAVPL
ncbi:hypothetical protein VNI00_019427 [Paramarasmius palmivorus]|uniref:O-methyltransferase C-terminal domain-containing protein n=1 Tax=Paramarasmius palmivorus TaxID=297713 RepID=A0AAW0AMD0_9AGAR